MAESKSTNKKSGKKQSGQASRPRRRRRDRFDCYGPVLGQLRREQGRTRTYLIFLVCTIFVCALLYTAYWFSMKG